MLTCVHIQNYPKENFFAGYKYLRNSQHFPPLNKRIVRIISHAIYKHLIPIQELRAEEGGGLIIRIIQYTSVVAQPSSGD